MMHTYIIKPFSLGSCHLHHLPSPMRGSSQGPTTQLIHMKVLSL